MDQVERALLVVSGDAKSSNLVADPQVRLILISKSHHALTPTADTSYKDACLTLLHAVSLCHVISTVCAVGLGWGVHLAR